MDAQDIYLTVTKSSEDLRIQHNPNTDHMPPLTRLQLQHQHEVQPLHPQLATSSAVKADMAGANDNFIHPVEHLQKSKVTVLVRRSVYFLLAGMLVYLLSWSPVLCRVTRGIIRYPDRMPTFVWVTTLGILLFYETFVIAQCTSMVVRIRQIMAAQRRCTEGRAHTFENQTILSRFHEQASKRKGRNLKRDTFYLSLVHVLSMPDWESIAFLAAGATVDLVSAVLFSIPVLREDVFGLPSEQQRAEPWATMAFLLVVWILTVSLTAAWEIQRHENNQSAETVAVLASDGAGDSAGGNEKKEAPPNMGSYSQKSLAGVFYRCYGHCCANLSTAKRAADILSTFDGFSLWKKLLIGFSIYIMAGIAIFFGWGFFMSLWIEASELPWILFLAFLAAVLSWEMYHLGKWRLKRYHNEDPKEEKVGEITTRMDKFATYHAAAVFFHLGLIGLSLMMGASNSDLDWVEDYVYLNRPSYFMTADWERVRQLNDNEQAKADLLAQAANSSDPFLGVQGATKPKIAIGFCATDHHLGVYFIFVCIGWSACSMLQHIFSWYRLKHYNAPRDQVNPLMEPDDEGTFKKIKSGLVYWVPVVLTLFMLTVPAIIRYGYGWQVITLQAVLLPLVLLALQVAVYGVFDLFDDADTEYPNPSIISNDADSIQAAKLAVKDVRYYKWIEYTLSATLMHCAVVYIGGVLSTHELVLSAGLLAVSMLFCNFTDACLDRAEMEDQNNKTLLKVPNREPIPLYRFASVITLDQMINAEMPFIFLSFFAKGILTVALTVPWVFVSRSTYVVQPLACS